VGSDAGCRPAGERWCWARFVSHTSALFSPPAWVLGPWIPQALPMIVVFALLPITYGVLFAVAIRFHHA